MSNDKQRYVVKAASEMREGEMCAPYGFQFDRRTVAVDCGYLNSGQDEPGVYTWRPWDGMANDDGLALWAIVDTQRPLATVLGVEIRASDLTDSDSFLDPKGRGEATGMGRMAVQPGYEQLAATLDAALEQAQAGKGKERHHTDGVPYHEQSAVTICRSLGSNHFAIGQAIKKARESARLPNDRARLELLGAINYLAAAYIALGGDS